MRFLLMVAIMFASLAATGQYPRYVNMRAYMYDSCGIRIRPQMPVCMLRKGIDGPVVLRDIHTTTNLLEQVNWYKDTCYMEVSAIVHDSCYQPLGSIQLIPNHANVYHQRKLDSIARVKHPITKKFPYGNAAFRNVKYKKDENGEIQLLDYISTGAIYQNWKFYLDELPDSLLDFGDGDPDNYLPHIDEWEDISFNSTCYFLRYLQTEREAGNDELYSVSFLYRFPNMGTYEVYYLGEESEDWQSMNQCREAAKSGKAVGCCNGQDYRCSAAGILAFYNRKIQSVRFLEVYRFQGNDDGDGDSGWLSYYIPNDSTIELYEIYNYKDNFILEGKGLVRVLKDGNFIMDYESTSHW